MAHKTTYKVKDKRRRQGKTNKVKRLALAKAGKPKLTVRITSNKVVCQLINYKPEGDETVVNTTSLELKNYGYKGHLGNSTAAYLTGYLCGKKAKDKKVTEAVLDAGLRTPVHKSNVFGALKGAVEAGLNLPHDEKVFPTTKEEANAVKSEIDKGIKVKTKK